jgi:flagella basal body P-ring formation protein FlgA
MNQLMVERLMVDGFRMDRPGSTASCTNEWSWALAMNQPLQFCLALLFLAWSALAADPVATTALGDLALLAEARVDRDGVYLDQIATPGANNVLPHVRLLDSPPINAPFLLTRGRVQEVLLGHVQSPMVVSNWSGADRVVIRRRTRALAETEVVEQLTSALQSRQGAQPGVVELRLARPWSPIAVPDEPLVLRLTDAPLSRMGSQQSLRFELVAGTEVVGTWPVLVQVRLWREIWVARSPLQRGQALDKSMVARERRDVLTVWEPLAAFEEPDDAWELTDSLNVGAPLLQRHLRARPVIRRGQTADAVLEDGALSLVVRVEALEDGAPGQTIRLRNPTSRREFRGKVQNEKTIQVCL